MKKADLLAIRKKAAEFLKKAHIAVTAAEAGNIEVADFGLGDIDHVGFEIVVYENNDRYCAKEIVLFPGQMCPEHRHPPVDRENLGKQETFRCRWGEAYLYTVGEPAARPQAKVPDEYRAFLTVWHEIILGPGDQYTLPPNTHHWFQAGSKGAIISEFSSSSLDELDIWTDPRIRRVPKVD